MSESKKNEKSTRLPQVYKKAELEAMIELIKIGLWRTNNLSRALHVSIETIADWKKRPEVREAHKQAILKFAKKRTDVEKILSELEVETVPDPASLMQVNTYLQFTDEQLDKLIETKARQARVARLDAGEGTTAKV